MAVAYVLISALPGQETEVKEELLKVKEVTEVYTVFGEYDLIIKMETDSIDAVGELVVTKIRKLEGVKETRTLVGLEID